MQSKIEAEPISMEKKIEKRLRIEEEILKLEVSKVNSKKKLEKNT